jgi:hypothetical protein
LGIDAASPDGDSAGGEASPNWPDSADAARSGLCIRLYDPMKPNYVNTLAEQVEGDYLNRVYKDCDVAKLVQAETDTLFMFANDLLFFSLDLWGCTKNTAMDFGLGRPEFPEMTSADVARLIDHYMAAATKILGLDTSEAAQMRADLTALGASAIAHPSEEFALSMCGADGGGDADAAMLPETAVDALSDTAVDAPQNDAVDAGGGS